MGKPERLGCIFKYLIYKVNFCISPARRGTVSVGGAHPTARGFLLTVQTFLLLSLVLTGSSGARRSTGFRWACDGEEHLTELVQASLSIARLVAVLICGQHELALSVDARPVGREEALANVVRQAWARVRVPVEHDLAVHLVDVLAARTRRARDRERELGDGNPEVSVDGQFHAAVWPRAT